MKILRTLAVLMIAGLVILGMAGCESGGAGSGALSEEVVLEAFGVSFTGYILASLDFVAAGSTPGATIDGATLLNDSISFTNYDLSTVSGTYSSMSGLATEIPNGLSFDFTLAGGVVTTVSYSFTDSQINATDEVTFTITANGDDYTITAAVPE